VIIPCGESVKGTSVGGDRGLDRVDVHAASCTVKADPAIDQGEDRVITPETDIASGNELGAALADDDVSGNDRLVAEFLHAETLADAVASVLDASLSFFMGHGGGWVGE